MLRQQQEAPLIQPFLQGLQQKATIVVNDPQLRERLSDAVGSGSAGRERRRVNGTKLDSTGTKQQRSAR